MNFSQQLLSAFVAAFLTLAGDAVAAPVRDQHIEVELVAETASIQPGHPFTVALRIRHDPHWHTYWENPGDAGLATTLDWELPEGFSAGPIQWPAPIIFKLTGLTNYGYEGEVFLLVEITPPESLSTGANITLRAGTTFLMCDDVCIPGKASLSLALPVLAAPPQWDERWRPAIERTRQDLPQPFRKWETAVYRDGDKLSLSLTAPDDFDQDLQKVYFYSSDAQVDPNAEQKLTRHDRGLILDLVRSTYAEDKPSVPGILVTESGWGEGENGTKAVVINADLQDGSPPGGQLFSKSTMGQNTGSSSEIRGFPFLLGLAFLGGLILNLMPCVFPVLGLKIMNFVNRAGEDKSKVAWHGIVFTGGVLISFWILTGVLALMRAGGQELGWGFQLQSPVFIFVLMIILLIFALNLSGLFEVGCSLSGAGGRLTSRGGWGGSFFSGVLATVVATPCAAPFLAPALGAALTIETGRAFFIFTSIGLGLSMPYLVLSLFPGLVKTLPRPGPWMETFRQVMAFPLYGAAGYLLWVMAGQVDEEGLLGAIFALVAIAIAGWVLGRWVNSERKPGVVNIARVGASILFLSGIYMGYPVVGQSGIEWEEWSPEKVMQLRTEDRPVYVDFTARWCATCQTNKKLVFSSKKVLEAFKQKKVVPLKADWTNQDARITKALARFNRSAVPFNILYIPGIEDPVILPEVLTPGIVLETLDKI